MSCHDEQPHCATAPSVSRAQPSIRPARRDDRDRLQAVRAAAFAPVFRSFKTMLGDSLYEIAQAHEDRAQEHALDALLFSGDAWEVFVVELDRNLVGFVSIQLNRETHVGEIGLNAVDPAYGGRGVGTCMYDFAVARMREAGMWVATVSTGDDPSHAPARRAYEKAGFSVSIPSIWLCQQL